MIANLSWNIANTSSGIVSTSGEVLSATPSNRKAARAAELGWVGAAACQPGLAGRAAELGWTGTVAPAVDFEYLWEADGDGGRVVPDASTAGQGGEPP
jgi:hypothetical protein